jgi:hypothetical protein
MATVQEPPAFLKSSDRGQTPAISTAGRPVACTRKTGKNVDLFFGALRIIRAATNDAVGWDA